MQAGRFMWKPQNRWCIPYKCYGSHEHEKMPPNAISSCAEVVPNETICYRQRENGYDRDRLVHKKSPLPPRVQSCQSCSEVPNFGGGFFYALLYCRHVANIARMGGRGRAFFTHQPVSRSRGVALSTCTANHQLCQSGHYNGDRISCHTRSHVSG